MRGSQYCDLVHVFVSGRMQGRTGWEGRTAAALVSNGVDEHVPVSEKRVAGHGRARRPPVVRET